jgi:hypothetical protein
MHIYVSMFGLAAVLFFGVTGLTLNHPDWFFDGKETVVPAKGELNPAWVRVAARSDEGRPASELQSNINPDSDPTDAEPDPLQGVARLEVVEHLRRQHGIKGFLASFTGDDRECVVNFKGPGYTADVFIDRSSGRYQLSQTYHGFVAVINDLHKGRDTGPVWSILIDASAIVMTVVSLSGLILIFYIKRRRIAGVAVGLLGLITLAVVWYLGIK